MNDANDVENIIRTSGEILLHSQSWQGKVDESQYRILRPVKLQTQSSQFGCPTSKMFNAETSLIKGDSGDFNVYVDSVLIFPKKKEESYPNEGEVERLIKNQSWSGFLS